MFVSDLALDWFRSYRSLVLHLEPGVTVFLGANGQGKTNLLEALNYLAVLSSHRIGTDAALIFRSPELENRAGVIRTRVHSRESEVLGETKPLAAGELLEIEIVAGRANRAMINRHKTRPRELIGHLSTVLFAPEDLDLVGGDPATRRSFLDKIAVELHPTLAGTLADLQKTLRQRGAYLKDLAKRHAPLDEIQIGIWDEALVPLFAAVMTARERVTRDLVKFLPEIYAQISGENLPSGPSLAESTTPFATVSATPTATPATETETARSGTFAATVSYRDNVSKTLDLDPAARAEMFADEGLLREKILLALQSRHADEARRGVNLSGTHRDDLALTLHDFPVKGYASHGETWSFALSLRLSEFYLLKEKLEDTPVLLLDDVFAELDELRRAALLGAIREADQVLVTSAMGTELPSELEGKLYRVSLNASRESQVEALEDLDEAGSNPHVEH